MYGSCRKTKKKFVGQRLGVTPESWLTPKRWLLIWNFVFLIVLLQEIKGHNILASTLTNDDI